MQSCRSYLWISAQKALHWFANGLSSNDQRFLPHFFEANKRIYNDQLANMLFHTHHLLINHNHLVWGTFLGTFFCFNTRRNLKKQTNQLKLSPSGSTTPPVHGGHPVILEQFSFPLHRPLQGFVVRTELHHGAKPWGWRFFGGCKLLPYLPPTGFLFTNGSPWDFFFKKRKSCSGFQGSQS